MSVEVGAIVDGVITGITNFGAFVDLGENKIGLVHISEVSSAYVRDVRDFFKEGDKVKVKILNIDDRGKIGLSIKQANPPAPVPQVREHPEPRMQQRPPAYNKAARPAPAPATFEDKISRFLKDSDDRLTDLKRNTESKRGGRGASRKG